MGCAASIQTQGPEIKWKSADFLGKKSEKVRKKLYEETDLNSEFEYLAKEQLKKDLRAQLDETSDMESFQVYTLALISTESKASRRLEFIRNLLIMRYPTFVYSLELIYKDRALLIEQGRRKCYEYFLVFQVTKKPPRMKCFE